MTAWLYEMAAQVQAAIATNKAMCEQAALAKRQASQPTLRLHGNSTQLGGFVEFSGMTPAQATHLISVLARAVPPMPSDRTA